MKNEYHIQMVVFTSNNQTSPHQRKYRKASFRSLVRSGKSPMAFLRERDNHQGVRIFRILGVFIRGDDNKGWVVFRVSLLLLAYRRALMVCDRMKKGKACLFMCLHGGTQVLCKYIFPPLNAKRQASPLQQIFNILSTYAATIPLYYKTCHLISNKEKNYHSSSLSLGIHFVM